MGIGSESASASISLAVAGIPIMYGKTSFAAVISPAIALL